MARSGASARTQRDARRVEIEQRLIEVLEQLLTEDPRFTELNLGRLLEVTGISRTTFYKYFDSKVDVLRAWFDVAAANLASAPREQTGPDAPTREELRASVRAIADVYRRRLPLMYAVYETAAHEYDMRLHLRDALSEFNDRVHRHMVRGQQAGWINPEIDSGATADWIVALCENGLRHIIGPAEPADLGVAADTGADLIWLTLYGLGPR